VRPVRHLRAVAAVAAAVVLLGVAGAGPASAAPKPRLPISLTAKPTDPSGSSTAGFSWTTVVGVTYTCVLDGVSTSGCTTPVTYTGLADGSHTFVVKGKKPGSYRPGSATWRWVVDSVPPGAPTIAPVATPTKTTSASISFVNPDVTTVAHQCSLDGAPAVTCTSPWAVAGPLVEGSHTVTVQALGLAGSLGGTASVSWVVDLTAPASVLLAGPTSPTNDTTAHFTFSSAGATAFTCALDGAAATACTSPLDVPGIAEGPHTMSVGATDGAGNAALTGTAVWTVDTTAPATPSVLTGPASATNQTGVDFVVDNPDTSSVLECSLDGAGWTTCPSPVHFTVATPGAHTLSVRSTDQAGNHSTPSTAFPWTLDTTAPAPAQFLSGPPSPTQETTADFDFVPSDQTDPSFNGFLCSFDGAPFVSCDIDTVPLGVGPLAEGPHTLQVETVDTAANPSAPATWSWTVDLTAPPVPTFGQAPASSTTSTSATFGFGSEAGAAFTCTLDAAAPVPCSSPYVVTGLALGAHTFSVSVSDAAGNTSQAAVGWTVVAPPAPPTPTPPAPPAPTPPSTPAAATTATVVTSPALMGRSVVTFSADVHATTASVVSLRVVGGAEVGAIPRCTTAAGAAVACTASFRTMSVTPAAPLVPGQSYTLAVGGVVDGSGAAVPATGTFRASTVEQESSLAAAPRWRSVRATGAYGHRYLTADRKGASVSFRFTGRKVTWFTTTGPAQGRATVYVDGVRRARVNNWSSKTVWHVARSVTGLKAGSHVLRVVVTGRKGATSGTGTAVAFDAVQVGKRKVVKTPVVSASWGYARSTAASGGGYAVEHLAGAAMSFAFRGTSLTWVTGTGPTMGKARVYVDGVLKARVDNYAKRAHWGVRRTVSGLSAAVHTVVVVPAGTKRKASKGTDVVVDRWLVG
jgi:hypothetical protein